MALKFPTIKLPIPKKPLIKGVKNEYLLGGIAIAGVVTYYYLVKEGYIQAITIPGLEIPSVPGITPAEGAGHHITYTITPAQVEPNSNVTIAGTVYGLNGQPQIANKIYYYVYREQSNNTTLHYTSGIAGELTATFSKQIPTTNYPPGSYLIVVSDTPLTATAGGVLPIELAGQTPPAQNIAPSEGNFGNSITIS
jgi:hypothetical protein